MIYLYNFLQLLSTPLLLLFAAVGLFSGKYRGRMGDRLGMGLADRLPEKKEGALRIWVHALSVGEVRSASVLLQTLGRQLPNAELILSSTTRTGVATARHQKETVRYLLPYPFDLWFSVRRFLDRVQPDLFVLVETDFWPNFLWQLHRRKIPAVLVNGRISEKSWQGYRAAGIIFRPLFSLFARLYLQTEEDAGRMRQLGVSGDRVCTAGNLKYDAALLASSFLAQAENNPVSAVGGSFLIVAGSTHAGEEEILLDCFCRLRRQWADCRLVIAPRDIGRAERIGELAGKAGLSCSLFSRQSDEADTEVIVLDVFGRLMECYARAAVAFIGGSLVEEGGHNPLEAAVFGKPVLFGPHMDDFAEIGRDLLAAGAARQVADRQALQEALFSLRGNGAKRRAMAQRAMAAVLSKSGSADRIVTEILGLLPHTEGLVNAAIDSRL